jgi:hypothetical protein
MPSQRRPAPAASPPCQLGWLAAAVENLAPLAAESFKHCGPDGRTAALDR